MRKSKIKKYLNFKKKFYLGYYNSLLFLFEKEKDKTIKEKLFLRISELEKKIKRKRPKICPICFSFFNYRVNKNFIICVCKNCGYQKFIKVR